MFILISCSQCIWYDYKYVSFIQNFRKGDEGIYKVRAKNEHGEGNATIGITLNEMIQWVAVFSWRIT